MTIPNVANRTRSLTDSARVTALRRSCPSGRARFQTRRAAAAVVGTVLVEPGTPEGFVPVAPEDARCGTCSGWHARGPWSPFASRGSRAARVRRLEDHQPWPVTVPAPTSPTAGRAIPRAFDVRRSGPAPESASVPPAAATRGWSALDEARRALGG